MAKQHPPAEKRTRLPPTVADKLRPPFGVLLGHANQAADLCESFASDEVTCYQMDVYLAARLREELDRRGLKAKVVTAADLWDLPADFRTLVYPVSQGGERELKIDVVEQAFHVLRLRGTLIVWSAYEKDQLFPGLLKKVFGKVHAPAGDGGTLLWCQREGDRPRRRHEVTFQVRVGEGPSLRFLSRPGVFSYGRFDAGARALLESALLEPGDRVLDVGCGVGTNGCFAAQRLGPDGSVVFLDSNVRATALAEHNARANGVARFEVRATADVDGFPERSFDVALSNPPYFAQGSIARRFVERSHALLKPGGRFYLVTRQPKAMGELVVEVFGYAEALLRRGYTVFGARAHEPGEDQEPVFDPEFIAEYGEEDEGEWEVSNG
jgi:23S rRNA (guanine1835-N2)-methyltransferase